MSYPPGNSGLVPRTLALLLFAAGCSDPLPPAASVQVPYGAAPAADFQARTKETQARYLLAGGKLAEADRAALEAGRLYQQLRGPLHPDTGRVAELYASIKLALHEDAAAEQSLLVALAAREAEAGPSTLRVAEVLDLLVKATEAHAAARAVSHLQRALAIRKATLPPDHPEIDRTLLALGTTLLKLCRAADAEPLLREALAIRERAAGPSSARVAEPLEKLAEARWQLSDDAGSAQLLARGAASSDPVDATDATPLVRLLGKLADRERDQKSFAAAAIHGERAVAIAERYLQATSEAFVAAADSLATTYRAQGNEAGVSALFLRLSLVERVLPPGALAPVPQPDLALRPPPSRCVVPGAAPDSGHPVSNAASVVAGLAPAFRACYNGALRQDPEMKGWVRMTSNIGPGGEVLRVRALTPKSFAPLMVECPMARLLGARFNPPEGGSATVIVPATFVSR